jgi:2-polyprenyl-3-methyl-5-hydroxy-6-metoxy-1,4-benzoquinol methylase
MDPTSQEHAAEVNRGERFTFGANWQRFLTVLNDDRIREAESSLRGMLGVETLAGKRFLDIGSGSGLFSLAARRLGATVHSMDYDPQSVACTAELRRRYFPEDPAWTVTQGSVLERGAVEALGTHDIVYSWGVLHHTGDMWKALQHATLPVAPGGSLFVSIYNDQGARSKAWRMLKRIYCSGLAGRWFVTALGSAYFFLVCLKEDLLRFRDPTRRYREYRKNRGMSVLHDWIDWFGGYPFEVAKVDQIFQFYHSRGFELTNLVSVGGALGCNEFVFRRE